jgi:hypothetical protein
MKIRCASEWGLLPLRAHGNGHDEHPPELLTCLMVDATDGYNYLTDITRGIYLASSFCAKLPGRANEVDGIF